MIRTFAASAAAIQYRAHHLVDCNGGPLGAPVRGLQSGQGDQLGDQRAQPVSLVEDLGAESVHFLRVVSGIQHRLSQRWPRPTCCCDGKTDTLTLGCPLITDILALDGLTDTEVLALAAGACRSATNSLAARRVGVHEPRSPDARGLCRLPRDTRGASEYLAESARLHRSGPGAGPIAST